MRDPLARGRYPAAKRFGWRLAAFAPLVGVLLVLPAIGPERALDDHVLELLARGGHPAVAQGGGSNLFHFATGHEREVLS